MISSALVKEKPETVPAGFVSEALILRSELISYNSNSFRINCRSMTKAERTRIGFPENFRHSAVFGKVRGQRGPHTYCYPKVKSVYKFDPEIIDYLQELVEQLFPPGTEIPERTSSRLLELTLEQSRRIFLKKGEHVPVHSGICWAHIKEFAGGKNEMEELPGSNEPPNDHEQIQKGAGLKRKRSQAW